MDFAAHIKRQYEVVGRFIDILDAEQDLLTGSPAEPDRLSALTEDKAACASKMEELEQARQTILSEQGYPTDRTGAERLAQAAGCLPLWQSFVERVGHAQARNRLNGMLINQRLEINEEALSTINSVSGSGLYGPDGQTSISGKHMHRSV